MILRIALSARRVASDDTRVRYSHGGNAVIPEELVLLRWRERTRTPAARSRREVFDGCRLPPHLWSALRACTEDGLRLDAALTAETLRAALDVVRVRGVRAAPARAQKYIVLLEWLRRRRQLSVVLQRERDSGSPGVPDLFLYRRQGEHQPYGCCFVEVKRQYGDSAGHSVRERLLPSQREELAFLKGLGLPARTVYVSEEPQSVAMRADAPGRADPAVHVLNRAYARGRGHSWTRTG